MAKFYITDEQHQLILDKLEYIRKEAKIIDDDDFDQSWAIENLTDDIDDILFEVERNQKIISVQDLSKAKN